MELKKNYTSEKNFLVTNKLDITYNLFFRLYKSSTIENNNWIVILHGILSSSAAMQGISEYLASKEYNVLAPDLLGHGYSTASRIIEEDYTISNMCDLIQLIIEKIGLSNRKFYLLGHSAGGIIAQEYIFKYPLNVNKLILSSTTCKPLKSINWKGGLSEEALRTFKEIAKEGAANVNRKLIFTETCNGNKSLDERKAAEIIGVTIARQANRDAISLFITQNIRLDYRKMLKNIKVPVMILIGDKDSLFKVDEAFYMYNEISDPYLHIFKGKGHATFITDFKRYKHIIYDFISGNLDKCNWYTNNPLPENEDVSVDGDMPKDKPYIRPYPVPTK